MSSSAARTISVGAMNVGTLKKKQLKHQSDGLKLKNLEKKKDGRENFHQCWTEKKQNLGANNDYA